MPPNWLCHPFWEARERPLVLHDSEVYFHSDRWILRSMYDLSCLTFFFLYLFMESIFSSGFTGTKCLSTPTATAAFKPLLLNGVSGRITPPQRPENLFIPKSSRHRGRPKKTFSFLFFFGGRQNSLLKQNPLNVVSQSEVEMENVMIEVGPKVWLRCCRLLTERKKGMLWKHHLYVNLWTCHLNSLHTPLTVRGCITILNFQRNDVEVRWLEEVKNKSSFSCYDFSLNTINCLLQSVSPRWFSSTVSSTSVCFFSQVQCPT